MLRKALSAANSYWSRTCGVLRPMKRDPMTVEVLVLVCLLMCRSCFDTTTDIMNLYTCELDPGT